MQYGTIRIGQVIKLLVDSFGEDALMDSLPKSEQTAWHKKISRLISEKDIRIDAIRDFENLFYDFLRKAKEKGYSVTMFGRKRPIPEIKSSNFVV